MLTASFLIKILTNGMKMKKIPQLVFWLSFASFSVSARYPNQQTTQTPQETITPKSTTCIFSRDKENIETCTRLADSGDAVAQNTLGEIIYNIKNYYKVGNHTKARLLFEKAAAQGLAKAQYNLGSMYRDEFNNFPVALKWFEKAAAQGNADAQNSIGYIYENASGGKPPRLYTFDEKGKSTDPNLPKIKAQFAKFDKSIPVNYFSRTVYPLSEYGQGVEPDIQKAFEWYQKAANQGHALAQANLAYFYLLGIVVEKDEKKAFELYEQAANQQLPAAIKSLAFMHMLGLGGNKVDVYKAIALLEQAYLLTPDQSLWRMIETQMFRRYKYLTKLKENSDIYPFPYTIKSDEDYIFASLYFLKDYYNLNMNMGSHILTFTQPRRKTLDVWLGKSHDELTTLKERYLTKKAIQGYYNTMTLLSYYYKDEVKDMQKAMLWRQYAIQMGQSDHPNFWLDYPTVEDDKPQ